MKLQKINILICGSKGFLAKNFISSITNIDNFNIYEFHKKSSKKKLKRFIKKSDLILHFAGENRSNYNFDFKKNNVFFTAQLFKLMKVYKRQIPIIYPSTIKFNDNTVYGKTKKMAEKIIKKNCKLNKINYSIIRFPNLFGKWAKPNYNSVVATFSYNLNRNFKCQINNNKYIKLLYIDDAINIIKRELKLCIYKKNYKKILYVKNFYKIRLTELHKIIKNLHTMLSNNQVPNLKKKINKQLWSTILSYFPNPNYTQQIHKFEDKRGYFLEFLKSEYGGQISFLTLNPGESRGFHYHNTKFEKFLVISGSLDFISYDFFEKKIKKVNINDQNLKYVFSIPGYVHIIKNKSKKICKVLIWANEIFDKDNPDTIRV